MMSYNRLTVALWRTKTAICQAFNRLHTFKLSIKRTFVISCLQRNPNLCRLHFTCMIYCESDCECQQNRRRCTLRHAICCHQRRGILVMSLKAGKVVIWGRTTFSENGHLCKSCSQATQQASKDTYPYFIRKQIWFVLVAALREMFALRRNQNPKEAV